MGSKAIAIKVEMYNAIEQLVNDRLTLPDADTTEVVIHAIACTLFEGGDAYDCRDYIDGIVYPYLSENVDPILATILTALRLENECGVVSSDVGNGETASAVISWRGKWVKSEWSDDSWGSDDLSDRFGSIVEVVPQVVQKIDYVQV